MGRTAQGKVVPWCSWREWRDVKRALVEGRDPSEPPDDQGRGPATSTTATTRRSGCREEEEWKDASWALDVVASWRARGRVPMAVGVTADIVQIKLRSCGGDHSSHVNRLALSMTLTRLVNGVSGELQKGVYAKSVANLAESVGLPRILVDLRHEATHNALPSMSVLSIAAEQALVWLRDNYWRRQAGELEEQREQVGGILRELVDLSSEDGEGSSTKRRRAELVKELLDCVHGSQGSELKEALYSLVVSKPFREQDGKGWRTFMAKICKYWPSVGTLLLERCWEGLKDGGEEARERKRSLNPFVRWLVESSGELWRHAGDEDKERSLLKMLYGMVIEGARLARAAGDEEGKGALKLTLKSFFQVLFSRLDRLDPATFEGLKITDRILGNVSGFEGPDLLLPQRPPPPPDRKRKEDEDEDEDGDASRVPWKRCRTWTPCAVGNLPSASDSNGRSPTTLLPTKKTIQ
ncbi:ribosomal biogenesis protein LAS1 [Chloropicon primus]|uniref:Ribosomal biogenesis protein LAS1 n=1 Tax=Chloropicon primus TaxID=1764295 RepID=A0A5B8MU70_9CHLO|nr:ribosomal biogenesis protein LAS1 [Chloropicon primus]UPR03536.1 ribosomal biogenesis protein LAS1 [Chloropicon primus]|eukprot:QDZ24328.1 ribosomal biogenesis protein LAS1 [Chloropicon primus]